MDMMVDYREINERIEMQKEEIIAFLEKLVNTESGIEQIQGVNQVGAIFKEACEALGMVTRTVAHEKAGDTLIAEYFPENAKNQAPIVFSGHMDTVFNPGVTEQHHFRLVEDKPGYARGAGLSDMKGGLVIAYYVVKNLIELGYDNHPLKMIFVPDEETLHRYSDTRNEMVAELSDAKMLLNFEPSDSPNSLVVGRQGGMMLSMTVEGIQGHSGMEAATGRSAIVELANKVVAAEALTDLDRNKLINCGLFNGGVSANTIPGHAKANFAVRFPNEAIKNEAVGEIEKIAEKTYIEDTKTTIEVESWVDAMEYTEEVDQLADHFIRVAAEAGLGEFNKEESQGASDASLGTLAGIPALDGLGIVGTGNHTLEEEADLNSIVPKICLSLNAVLKV